MAGWPNPYDWWKQQNGPQPTPSSWIEQTTPTPQATSTPTAQEWFSNPETFKRNTFLKFPLSQQAYDKVKDARMAWQNDAALVGMGGGDGGAYWPGMNYISLTGPSEIATLHELGHDYDMNDLNNPNILADHPVMSNFIATLPDDPASPLYQIATNGDNPQDTQQNHDYNWNKNEIVARLIEAYPQHGNTYPPDLKALIGTFYDPTMTPGQWASPAYRNEALTPTLQRPQPIASSQLAHGWYPGKDVPHNRLSFFDRQPPWNTILRLAANQNQTYSRAK